MNYLNITNAALHILDNTTVTPILSVKELELEIETSQFFEKHINKILVDGAVKKGYFNPENNVVRDFCIQLGESSASFLDVSSSLGNSLFSIMKENPTIPPADVAFVLFELGEIKYFCILKLNYKNSFTHYVVNTEDGSFNQLIKHKTTLPNDSQKADECVLVNLSTLEINLLEKQYEICGEKDFYLSNHFLKCKSDLSNLQKVKIIEKVAAKVSKKYFDESFDKVSKLKSCVAEEIEETNTIEIDKVAQAVFGEVTDIKNYYMEEVQRAGLVERVVEIPENINMNKLKTQKIKTDNGIEINFPANMYSDKDSIEFINNPDGTISILIKNVGKVINR